MTNPTRTDRIDFIILADGTTIVTKMWRHPSKLRDIPHTSTTHPPGEFDLDAALAWCKANDFTVKVWPGSGKAPTGARAWRGTPWPIRTARQIVKKRRQLERVAATKTYNARSRHPTSSPDRGWDRWTLYVADLAFVGEPRPVYNVGEKSNA